MKTLKNTISLFVIWALGCLLPARDCPATGADELFKGGNEAVSKKVLVVYGTWAGSTAEVADSVGKALAANGWIADVKDVKKTTDVAGYQAVVIGSGVRAGKVHPEIRNFVKKHKAGLHNVPVAYFVVCLKMKEDLPENRAVANAYLDPLRADVWEVDAGLFGGKMDPSRLNLFGKLIQKFMMPAGDFRNWQQINGWAKALALKLNQ
jgi:menaquinone-dependent protoporphyrinogen oxidase